MCERGREKSQRWGGGAGSSFWVGEGGYPYPMRGIISVFLHDPSSSISTARYKCSPLLVPEVSSLSVIDSIYLATGNGVYHIIIHTVQEYVMGTIQGGRKH